MEENRGLGKLASAADDAVIAAKRRERIVRVLLFAAASAAIVVTGAIIWTLVDGTIRFFGAGVTSPGAFFGNPQWGSIATVLGLVALGLLAAEASLWAVSNVLGGLTRAQPPSLGQRLRTDRLVAHLADAAPLRHRRDADLEVEAHRLLVEELLDGELLGGAGLGFDVGHLEPLRLCDLCLDVVARQERRRAVGGDVPDERVDLALAGVALLQGLGPPTDVLDGDLARFVERDQPLELLEPLPAGLAAVVGLRFEFAHDCLGDHDGRAGELAGVNPLGDPPVDDHARVRDEFHVRRFV